MPSFSKSVNPDRMRYQTNKASFYLCLLAIAFNIAALITAYTDDLIKPDIIIGLDVMINIVFLLSVFMASEKTKAYSVVWGKAVIIIGAAEIARILMVPLIFLVKEQYTIIGFVLNVLFLSAAGISLISAGIICRKRAAILNQHLHSIGVL